MNDRLPGWTVESIDGHDVEVYTPPSPSEHAYTVIYLHGLHLASLSRNAVFTREFARCGLRAMAPITNRSWWCDRICSEFDPSISAEQYLLKKVVPFAGSRWGAQAPRLALLGTSMGGQGALRLAFKHPRLFPVVAALAPAIDYQSRYYDEDAGSLMEMYDSPESVRQDTATLHLHPLNWPVHTFFACDPTDARWHESAERLRSKLSALGIPYECDLETEAGGHHWKYYDAMAPKAVQFIADRLERERLRIV